MRRVFRRLKEGFKPDETITPLLKRIVIRYFGKVNLIDEYYRMLEWCSEKKEKPSLRRFSLWVKKSAAWDAQRKERENPEDQDKITKALDYEEKRSKERLRRFHDGRE